jgi:hypothetical protein
MAVALVIWFMSDGAIGRRWRAEITTIRFTPTFVPLAAEG